LKRWESLHRLKVGLDFGHGKASCQIGETAIAEGRVYLQFDSAFVSKNINPSPIRLRLDNSLQEGANDLEGLPGLLHDSLPDGWARLVLDRALRKEGFDHTSLTILDRLALVGTNGSGALTYTGPRLKSFEPPAVDFDTAAALVSKAPEEEDGDRVRDALTLTGSLGGARPKANVWRHGDAFSTVETPGAMLWLVKFPAKGDGTNAGAVEYAYSLMAQAAGIDMPPTTLLPSKETAGYFAVQRFDRTADGGRLHMHSLGGLLNATTANSALGYKELLIVTGSLTQQSGTDIPSIEQQIARMAFNVFARNRDDHVKNHAFLMDDNGRWSLAPAFDLTYSNLQEHALLVGSAGRSPGLSDILEVARQVSVDDNRTKEIVERVRASVADWKIHAKEANVTPAFTREIDASLNPPVKGEHDERNQAAYAAWQSGLER
jgi:serine/threonine-protein kinase HipA